VESEGSLPCSEQPNNEFYLDPGEASPYIPILFLLRCILTSPSHQQQFFQQNYFLWVNKLKYPMNFSSMACVLHAASIASYRTIYHNSVGWRLQIIWSSSLFSPATCYLSLRPNIPLLVTLFSDTLNPCSSWMWEVKFHTHTNKQHVYIFLYLVFYIFVKMARRNILNWVFIGSRKCRIYTERRNENEYLVKDSPPVLSFEYNLSCDIKWFHIRYYCRRKW
jgi:hypothetical protein